MKTLCEKPRLRRLLDHFSAVTDPREQWRVAYPLPEVLLLVVCGTIASCDDYDDIVDWGEAHLACAASCPIITASPARSGCAR